MARYSIKLVDRAGYTSPQEGSIQAAVQKEFDEAFAGTQDGVVVAWGDGNSGDNLVVHFVSDVEHSYIKKKWPEANIKPMDGGFTYTGARPTSATEVYRNRGGRQFRARELAVTVFHETMHNLYPYQTTAFVHELDGGGDAAGIAGAHFSVHTPMTDHNKELIRRGFSVKNPQYL